MTARNFLAAIGAGTLVLGSSAAAAAPAGGIVSIGWVDGGRVAASGGSADAQRRAGGGGRDVHVQAVASGAATVQVAAYSPEKLKKIQVHLAPGHGPEAALLAAMGLMPVAPFLTPPPTADAGIGKVQCPASREECE